MKGEGFFPDFDPIFGLQVDHRKCDFSHGYHRPELKFGPSCNDRIGPVATMFLVEWWKCVGPYPMVVHMIPRAAGPWRARLGNVPKSVKKYTIRDGDPAEIWLNVPDFSAKSEETRRTRVAAFSSTVNVEAPKDHALAEPDDFTVWQFTCHMASYLIYKTDYSGRDSRFPVYARKINSTDMRLGLPLRRIKNAWAYCNETKNSPASTSALSQLVNQESHKLRKTIDEAASAHQDTAHFEIDLRSAKEAIETCDRLRQLDLTPPKLAWAAVERFRKFRGNPDAIDAEAFMFASAHEQIDWLQPRLD